MGNTTSSGPTDYRPIDTMDENELTPNKSGNFERRPVVADSEKKETSPLNWVAYEELSKCDFPRLGERVQLSSNALKYSSTLRTFYELAVPKNLMLLMKNDLSERYCFVPATMSYDEFRTIYDAAPGVWYVLVPKLSVNTFNRCIDDEIVTGIEKNNDQLYKASKWPLIDQLASDAMSKRDECQPDSDAPQQQKDVA